MLYNMSYPHDQPGAPQLAVAVQQPVKPTLAAPPPVVAAGGVARPKLRCSQPMAFDPEELSQKLNQVIADRQLYAERRWRARAEAAAAAGNAAAGPKSPTQPPHASIARGYLDQGSLKPGRSYSVLNSISRPRTEPAAKRPAAPHDRPDISGAPPKSKTFTPKSKTFDDSRISKSKDSSKRTGSGEKHHYIPQFAASQFARTTTADNMPEGKGLVHKLSRTALRIAQAHRERHQQERNNFYSDRIPETADDNHTNDRARRERKQHRHSIEGAPAGRNAQDHRSRAARRASTGADLLMTWDSGVSSPNHPPYGYDSPDVPNRDPDQHRVDWTQSDEAPQPQSRPQRKKSRPSLRKADSIWALKNKLGAFTKHRSEDHQQQQQQQQRSRDTSPPSDTTLRSPKSGFFSRFKVTH